VGAAEIAHVLKQIGERVTDDEVDEMILMGDLDGAAKTGIARPPLTLRPAGDGQLSFEEFSKLMKTLALPRAAPSSARASSDAGRGAAASPVPSPGNALQARCSLLRAASATHLAPGAGNFPANARTGRTRTSPSARQVQGGGHGAHRAYVALLAHPAVSFAAYRIAYSFIASAATARSATLIRLSQDGTGLVNLSDFCRMLRVERSPFVERLFAMFDTDRDGLVDLKEFIIGLSNVSGDVREDKVRFAFELFDMDGSGYIEEPELRRIVRATNLASEKQLDRKVRWLLSQCDGDGDGKISLAEFEGLATRFPNAVFPAVRSAGAPRCCADNRSRAVFARSISCKRRRARRRKLTKPL